MASVNRVDRYTAGAGGSNEVRQDQFDISQEKNMQGIVVQLYNSSRDLYQALIRDLSTKKRVSRPLRRRLENGYIQYVVWADDHGAQDGRLDVRLEISQRLRRFTIRLLMSICILVHKACLAHTSKQLDTDLQSLWEATSAAIEEALHVLHDDSIYSDTESDDSDEDEPGTTDASLKVVTDELLDEIGNLLDLDPRLEEPVPDLPMREKQWPDSPAGMQAAPLTPSVPHDCVRYCADRVLAKFPKCDPNLATMLGKANWDSITRLHREREAITTGNQGRSKENTPTLKGKTTCFENSGSVASSPTTYAATIISNLRDSTARAEIPPLPSGIKKGQSFPCIACGKQVEKQSVTEWKEHLLADLQPWVCYQTSCLCDHMPLATREEWIEHLRGNSVLHPEWNNKTCPICSEAISWGGLSAMLHVAHHLEEISLANLPYGHEDTIEETRTGVRSLPLLGKASSPKATTQHNTTSKARSSSTNSPKIAMHDKGKAPARSATHVCVLAALVRWVMELPRPV
ncbi:hypothetical protein F5Y05DRAFT_407051 [Hypoxylon sp. FL0543]|nr:hypothetical protein F5Y05DRAFT_407051 [Hypoxylon sp. FL0543]